MGTRHAVAVFAISLFFVLSVVGCSPITPETVIVKETVIAEIPFTVQVTAVAETILEPATPTTELTVPRTETTTLHSLVRDRDYDIYIALPKSYSSTSARTYPVVYLLDGDLIFIWTTEYARWLNSGDALPEMRIVGIDNSRQRNKDLLPEQGGVEMFLTFIQQELVPYIDDNYRTTPSDRTLVGAGYGGLFTLFTLFHSPETFNRYIVATAALSKDDLVFQYEEEFASAHSELPVKLFLAMGGRESTANMRELYDRLVRRNYDGLEMNLAIIEEAGHYVTFLQGVADGLRAVFGR